jgi:hypothetical protein
VTCYGQESATLIVEKSHASPVQKKDSETLKELEIALIKLDAAEQREKLLNQRLGEKDTIIQAREDTIAAKNEVIDLLKANRQDSDKIDTGDQRMLVACNEQLGKAENRIKFLENPPILARLFNPDVIISGIVGYGIGKATAGGSSLQVLNPFNGFSSNQGSFQLYQPNPEDKVREILKRQKAQ